MNAIGNPLWGISNFNMKTEYEGAKSLREYQRGRCNYCGRPLPDKEEMDAVTWLVCPCGTAFDVFEPEKSGDEPEFDSYPEERAWWIEKND